MYIRAAVKFQNGIGWGELFKGRILFDFQRAVTSQLAETHVGIEYTTQQRWTVPLITSLLFDTMELFWSDRNQARHGSTPEEELAIRQVNVANKIDNLLTRLRDQPRSIRSRLITPRPRLLSRSLFQQELWVEQVTKSLSALEQQNLPPNSSTTQSSH